MAKVIGIGGVFFRCKDPRELTGWYGKWLGVPLDSPYSALFPPDTMPAHGLSVWAAFDYDTDYFAPVDQTFMINLIVHDLDAALAQVEEGGGERAGTIVEEQYGRFGWFIDPAGYKVELWQPAATSVDHPGS